MATPIPMGKEAPIDPDQVYSIVIYGNSTSADTKAISTALARYHARPSSLAAVATTNQHNPDLRTKILKYRLSCIDNLSTQDSSLDVELSAEQMDDLTENGAGQGAVIHTNAKIVALGSKTGNTRTRLNITGTSVFQLERPSFPVERLISLTNILAGNFNINSHLTFVGHVLAVRDYTIADARNDMDKYWAVAYITNTALADNGNCILLVSKWPLLGGQDNISNLKAGTWIQACKIKTPYHSDLRFGILEATNGFAIATIDTDNPKLISPAIVAKVAESKPYFTDLADNDEHTATLLAAGDNLWSRYLAKIPVHAAGDKRAAFAAGFDPGSQSKKLVLNAQQEDDIIPDL